MWDCFCDFVFAFFENTVRSGDRSPPRAYTYTYVVSTHERALASSGHAPTDSPRRAPNNSTRASEQYCTTTLTIRMASQPYQRGAIYVSYLFSLVSSTFSGSFQYQISRELGFVLQPTIAQRASLLLSLNQARFHAHRFNHAIIDPFFSRQQLTEHIRLYLVARNLIDESVRPVVVRCGDDPIGKVLGVREFTLVHDTLWYLLNTRVEFFLIPLTLDSSLLLPHCRKVTVQRPDAPAVIAAVAAAAASRARNRDIAATPTPTRPFIVPPSALRPSDSGPSAASRREAARSREEQSRESRPSIGTETDLLIFFCIG